jgi:hypothetical protein
MECFPRPGELCEFNLQKDIFMNGHHPQELSDLLSPGSLFEQYVACKKEKAAEPFFFRLILAKISDIVKKREVIPASEIINKWALRIVAGWRTRAQALFSLLAESSEELERKGYMESAAALMEPALSIAFHNLNGGENFNNTITQVLNLARKASDPKSSVNQRSPQAAERAATIILNLDTPLVPAMVREEANSILRKLLQERPDRKNAAVCIPK